MKQLKCYLSCFLIFALLMCFCVACGKKSDDKTEAVTIDNLNNVDIGDDTDIDEIATDTEAATETAAKPADIVTTEEITEETTEASTEEVEVAESGVVKFQGVTIKLPEGYEYSADNSSIDAACFVNDDTEAAIILCVDANNTAYNQSNLESVFDSQIKAIYGEFVTHGPKTYNDIEGIEWVLDNADEGTYGRAFAVVDGKMLIYVEFFSNGNYVADYEAAVNSLQY